MIEEFEKTHSENAYNRVTKELLFLCVPIDIQCMLNVYLYLTFILDIGSQNE
jgi:hypothetical protein